MKTKKYDVDHSIDTAGHVTLPDLYDFLCELWNESIEDRPKLISFGVANQQGILTRDKITVHAAYKAIDAITSIDIITPAYEIGYVKK